MSTVGYGDYVLNTAGGRVITSLGVLLGIVVIAMPLSIVGQRFDQEWSNRELMLMVARLRLLMIEHGWSANDVYAAFSTIDQDSNGVVRSGWRGEIQAGR